MKNCKMDALTPNIMVNNVNETLKFYQDVLGFDLITTYPQEGEFEFAIVQHGNVKMMFQEKNSLVKEYPRLGKYGIGGGLTLFIEIENVDYMYNQLVGKVNVIKDLYTTFYNMKEFAVEDCNGFVLTFAQKID
ncbi:MAG: bleomycin resistance family protein [Proteobacteria bacterium]|nr:bleomycin resistance family protein [Pseudomonadota bacterium]